MKGAEHSALTPVGFILVAAFSVQGGAAIAKGIFPLIGVAGTAAIRIVLSAIILLIVFRPSVHRSTAEQWRAVVPYGITIGVMNLLFYEALVRIPLGLAIAGIALIAPFQANGAVDPVGVIHALLTGACWAAYIVLGGRVSQRLHAGAAVATGMAVAALVVAPFALVDGGIGTFVRWR